MKGWREFIKDYLIFTRRERIGILCLLAFLSILLFYPKLSGETSEAFITEDSSVLAYVDTLTSKQAILYQNDEEHKDEHQFERSSEAGVVSAPFTFDPNTLSIAGWEKLGLKPRVARTIDNYRKKGGRFYKPEDLKKIWGLPEGFYEKVESYISLPAKEPFKQVETREYSKPQKKNLGLEINSADSSAFIALPGIGNKLANRIIHFREKLGGFYSVSQVAETYGIPDSTFQKIKPFLSVDENKIRKININTASKDELKLHPYIKWNLASALVEYRNQHGTFNSIEGLKNVHLVNDEVYRKMLPYVTID